MLNYQATPDYYRDYIEHGWLKDQAAKVHKYIKRWKNAAGKWVYQYKQPASDGRSTHLDLDERENDKGYSSSRSQADIKYGSRNARLGLSYWAPVKGLSDHGNARSYSKQGINRGIAAGRKRATGKGYKIKGYSGNLISRGYSGSRGSGESKRVSNTGTRKSVKAISNKSTMTDKVRRGQAMGSSNSRYDKPFKMGNVIDANTGKMGAVQYGNYRTADFVRRANGRNAQKRHVRYSPTYKTTKKTTTTNKKIVATKKPKTIKNPITSATETKRKTSKKNAQLRAARARSNSTRKTDVKYKVRDAYIRNFRKRHPIVGYALTR